MQSLSHCGIERRDKERKGGGRFPKERENSQFGPGLPGGYGKGVFVKAGKYNTL